jgi:hypothetical protein
MSWPDANANCVNQGTALYLPNYMRELDEMIFYCPGQVYIGYYRQVKTYQIFSNIFSIFILLNFARVLYVMTL